MRQPKSLALILSLSAAAAFAGNVATVNGVAISDAKVDFYVKQVTERGQKDTPELRAKVKEELVRNEVLYQEAQKKGLDKTPDVQQRLDFAKQQILVGALINDFVKANPVSDADLKKEYDKNKAGMSGKEYKARHILVKTKEEADAIEADLKKGKKFDDIAKAKSLDTGSAKNGGDLGWANPAGFVPEFGKALTALTKGKVSDPVQTQFGWHVIKLDDVRDAKGPSFDEVKAELQRAVQGDKVQKYVEDLTSKAKVGN
ncbi:putative parvulin-type peptidyl-prolyl cis-trans isomerase [Andreprevotia sp. IGB-42]|uniref:peptidylprolyl isomerase n=1 Tax=Andreprevotia sp. IGB-42 TaxID=2497473 RepID=UPI001356C677|nr:peptidyl-prolyl cis-trans isomerase [Andreprevotia sp. IGB-42]KAF0814946.1 putative parvulin-type peptidyl-prolyl cis-trans isomerase [Andreprevotia sp. IGB-42]